MNRHTQIRQAVLARLREQCGDSATFFDGLPAFIDAQELPAVAVWLSDAQYTGKMTDEDDWQAVLHIAVFIRHRHRIQSWICGWRAPFSRL